MKPECRLTGRVVETLIGADPASLVTSPREHVRVTFDGFEGDRHGGRTRLANARDPRYPRGTEIRNDRQVTVVSAEELEEAARRMGVSELRAAWIGANLLLAGVPRLTGLPPGTRLVFPREAVLVVRGENLPCRSAGDAVAAESGRPELASRFPRAALHLRGLVACVERPGLIGVGDAVRVEVPAQRTWAPGGPVPPTAPAARRA